MPLAYWCVLIAACLPIVCTGMAKAGSADFDNANPRGWQNELQGWRKRANAAQNNSFEAFPLFAAAVIIAVTQGAPTGLINGLALAYVALRLGYIAAYVGDKPTLRSALFALAFFVALAIFTSPAWAS